MRSRGGRRRQLRLVTALVVGGATARPAARRRRRERQPHTLWRMADDHPQRVTPQRRRSHLRGAASRLVQDAPVAETHEGNREIRPEAHDRRSVERARRNADRGRDDRGRKSPAARSQRLPRQGPGPHERQGPIQRSRGARREPKASPGLCAYTLDDAYAAIATIDLRVRAPVTLTVAPRAAHNGTRIVFRGRLRAGPGRRGTIVTIYALSLKGRKRIPVD